MSDNDWRNARIEEAAKAIAALHASSYVDEHNRATARAALSVFEKALGEATVTPTDDERDALSEANAILARIVSAANKGTLEGEDGFILGYQLSVGPIHAAIPFLQKRGIAVTWDGEVHGIPKPGKRLDPAFRAELVEFAKSRIADVWSDVPIPVSSAQEVGTDCIGRWPSPLCVPHPPSPSRQRSHEQDMEVRPVRSPH